MSYLRPIALSLLLVMSAVSSDEAAEKAETLGVVIDPGATELGYRLQSNSDGPIRHLFTVLAASKAPESARMVADLLCTINKDAKLHVMVLGGAVEQARTNLRHLLLHDGISSCQYPDWERRVSFTELRHDATLWPNAFLAANDAQGQPILIRSRGYDREELSLIPAGEEEADAFQQAIQSLVPELRIIRAPFYFNDGDVRVGKRIVFIHANTLLTEMLRRLVRASIKDRAGAEDDYCSSDDIAAMGVREYHQEWLDERSWEFLDCRFLTGRLSRQDLLAGYLAVRAEVDAFFARKLFVVDEDRLLHREYGILVNPRGLRSLYDIEVEQIAYDLDVYFHALPESPGGVMQVAVGSTKLLADALYGETPAALARAGIELFARYEHALNGIDEKDVFPVAALGIDLADFNHKTFGQSLVGTDIGNAEAELNRLVRQLVEIGLRVIRAPMANARSERRSWSIPGFRDSNRHLSYLNILVDGDEDGPILLVPDYGIPVLERAARQSYERAGFRVRFIRGMEVSVMGWGGLNCATLEIR